MVDAPEIAERIRDTDKEAGWIPGAFPTIMQNETGDPYNYVDKEVDRVQWGPCILRSKGWRAQGHMTFMYWWVNVIQRFNALSAKRWSVKDTPEAAGWTTADLPEMPVQCLSTRTEEVEVAISAPRPKPFCLCPARLTVSAGWPVGL